jgi:hypothetical protein
MGKSAAASRLPERAPGHGGTVDNKVLLKSDYSKADQFGGAIDRKRTPDHWSERVSMTALLFLSLGLWAALWEAVRWLAESW